MASEFKVRYSFAVTPYETVEFTDTTQTSTKVHTTIDKSFYSSQEYTTGTLSTTIRYKDSHTTTTSPVALSDSSVMNVSVLVRLVYIKILSAASTGTPDVYVQFGNETSVTSFLQGVGDAMALPVAGNTNSIKIFSSGATTRANVEILIANLII